MSIQDIFTMVSFTFASDKARSTNCPPCLLGVESIVRVCAATCWSRRFDANCGCEILEPCSNEADGWCGYYYDVCCDEQTGEPRVRLNRVETIGEKCNVNIDFLNCVPLCE